MVWFETLTFWHWFAIAAALMILEIVIPGIFLMWLGIAALVTGGVFWFLPGLTVELQLISFAVLSVISMMLGRLVYKSRKEESDQPLLNQRGEQYVGGIYTLEGAMFNGNGKVRIGDTVWSVEMAPVDNEIPPVLPQGDFVKVTGVQGSTLVVEAASDRTWKQDIQADET